jgi:hypothetical protein
MTNDGYGSMEAWKAVYDDEEGTYTSRLALGAFFPSGVLYVHRSPISRSVSNKRKKSASCSHTDTDIRLSVCLSSNGHAPEHEDRDNEDDRDDGDDRGFGPIAILLFITPVSVRVRVFSRRDD